MNLSRFLCSLLLVVAAAAQEKEYKPKEEKLPGPPVTQPIAYSHKTHVAMGMKCTNCHTMPGDGFAATFPKETMCMGCHTTINPLGFTLENFDAAGRFRTEENHKPVNTKSEYTTANGDVVTLQRARDLATHASTSPEARRGYVRQMFQFLIKQPPAAYGAGALEKLDADFVSSGYHIRQLFISINTLAALPPP